MRVSILTFLLFLNVACCRVPGTIPESICVAEDPIPSSVDYDWVQGDWWQTFEDPQLNALIERALANNPTMQETIDRIDLACYRARIVKSALYPSLDFRADSTKFAQSKTGIFGPIASGPLAGNSPIPSRYTQTEYSFNFSWEIDIWKKNWNAWHAALSNLEAKKAQEIIVRQILSLAVAEAYFQLQIHEIRAELARLNVQYREALSTLSQRQAKQNVQTNLVLNQRTSDIAYAKELQYALELNVERDKNLIRALVAEECCHDVDLIPASVQSWEKFVAYLPDELPLDVLAHRPDIQAYIWRVKAAGHDINVARALFYPNVNFMALLGQQTIHFSKLFNSDSFYGNWGPAIHLPIFEGGALTGNLEAQKTEYRIAVDQYHQGVLTAIRQVLDAIAAKSTATKQLFEVQLQRSVAEKNVQLTELRLKSHIDSRFNVLSAEIDLLILRDDEALMQWNNVKAVLELVRALGGGYSIC